MERWFTVKTIGLIVNPKAGVGGSVALKGSDGEDIYEEAIKRGASEKAHLRCEEAFSHLLDIKDEFKVFTGNHRLGEDEMKKLGLNYEVVYETDTDTTAEDTKNTLKEILKKDVDMIVFAGGDGTARDVYDAVGLKKPVIGIPAGTKMHSSVFGVSPKSASEVIRAFLLDESYEIIESEVMDIDEDAFRKEILNVKLYGALNVVNKGKMMQVGKSPQSASENADLESIAQFVVDEMKDDTLYIVGSGSTIRPVMKLLGLENSLLGVDLVYNKKLIKKDASEKDIYEALMKYPKRKIIVTIIGGQGYIFGRGNQQFSSRVIREVGKENIIVIATQSKLNSIAGGNLLADTGDDATNEYLAGYYNVIVDYNYMKLLKLDYL